MTTKYRWNQAELAAAYDAGAEHVHPYYRDVQDAIIELVSPYLDTGGTLVDLGAGSGRLVERCLDRFPDATAVLVDQSEPFLELASRRLGRFADRFRTVTARLQDGWSGSLDSPAAAIVSMSAIHHLDPEEKQACYRQAHEALGREGLFANGDEVRAAGDDEYAGQCRRWGEHMSRIVAAGLVAPPMADALRGWRERNIDRASQPRRSGDDCHETSAAQLGYLREAGFSRVAAPWSRELWTVLAGWK